VTKTEYRRYIGSPQWQQRRKQVLRWNPICNRCSIPRWLAELVYDQDLHVHHLSYANVGDEADEDLEVLCRRCHEVETFGRSELRAPVAATCEWCGRTHWDRRSRRCMVCYEVIENSYLEDLGASSVSPDDEESFVPTVRIAMCAMIAATSGSPLHIKEFLSALVMDYLVNMNFRPPMNYERMRAICEDFDSLLDLIDFPSDSGKEPNFLKGVRERTGF